MGGSNDWNCSCCSDTQTFSHARTLTDTRLERSGGEAPTPLSVESGQFIAQGDQEWPSATQKSPLTGFLTVPMMPASSLSGSQKALEKRTIIEPRNKKTTAVPSTEILPLNGDMKGLDSRHAKRQGSSQSLSFSSKSTLHLNSSAPKPSIRLHYDRPQIPVPDSETKLSTAHKLTNDSSTKLGRVIMLHQRIQDLRLQVQGQRVLVQSMREVKSNADEQYIKTIRIRHVMSHEPDKPDDAEVVALETLWRLCQAARDAYGPEEDALTSMERRLEIEEAKLRRAEERLYDQFDYQHFAPTPVEVERLQNQYDEQDKEEDVLSEQDSVASEPTDELSYDDYLRRLGNQDILQEDYDALLNEKAVLEAEQERRRHVGIDLDAEHLKFLADFTDMVEPVKKELEEVSQDVELLKQQCIEQGLMDVDGNPIQKNTTAKTTVSVTRNGSQTGLHYPQSKPSQLQMSSGNNELDSRASNGYGDYGCPVNAWLLDKLRSSYMEILSLTNYITARIRIINVSNWQAEVLRLWDRDGTGTGAETDTHINGATDTLQKSIMPPPLKGNQHRERQIQEMSLTRRGFVTRFITGRHTPPIMLRPRSNPRTSATC